jgi:hypothetical protein
MTDYDLLTLGLTPEEITTALYMRNRMLDGVIYASTADLAALLGCSDRNARRVVASLLEKGLIARSGRSQYVPVLAADGTEVAAKRTPVSANSSVYLTSKASTEAVTPTASNEAVVGGAAPVKGVEVIKEKTVARYDYETEGNDIGGVGFIGERPTPPAKKPKVQQYRNLVPREQWSMDDVVADFRQRVLPFVQEKIESWHDLPNLRGNHTGGNSMMFVLKGWQREGLSPQDVATLLDDFLADERETSKITNALPAYKLALAYIQRNIDTLLGKKVSPADLDRIMNQELTW